MAFDVVVSGSIGFGVRYFSHGCNRYLQAPLHRTKYHEGPENYAAENPRLRPPAMKIIETARMLHFMILRIYHVVFVVICTSYCVP